MEFFTPCGAPISVHHTILTPQLLKLTENIKEHDRVISGPKRRFKKATGVGRLKRVNVPIAVLVPRVKLRLGLDVKGATLSALRTLVTAIQQHLSLLS